MRIFIKIGGTIMSAIATIALDIIDIQGAVSILGFNIEWKWFILLAFVVFLSFVIWWIYGLESYKNHIENTRPNLTFDQQRASYHYSRKDGHPMYYAIQAWFINNPKIKSNKSEANNVTAKITFYDKNNKEFDMYGCFTEAEVLDYATIVEIKDLKDEIDNWPPNDIPRKLLIALKWTDDDTAYGLNRSNLLEVQLKDQSKILKKGLHFVKILFKGIGIDQQTFWFSLENSGKRTNIKLDGPIRQPNFRK